MHRSLLLILYILASLTFAQAQPSTSQVNKWVKALCVKKDPHNAKLSEVLQEITETDSSTWCQTMDNIRTSAQRAETRCQIRTKLLQHSLTGHGLKCAGYPDNLENFQQALQNAYEIEDDALQYELHLRLGQKYVNQKQFGLAGMHFHLLFDILERNNREEFYLPARTYFEMSYCLYHAHDYPGCIENGLNSMFALPTARFQPDDTLDANLQMQSWNTIGLAYQKTQQYESAFQAFNKAAQLANQTGNNLWVSIIKGNLGDVYYDLGQYDSARVLLQYDYDKSAAAHIHDNAANSLQWIARIDLQEGHTQLALQKLRTALQLLSKQPAPNYLANIYYALSRTYTALGQADSSNTYLTKYLHLHDSLETEITKSNAEIVQMRMANLKQIHTIKNLNHEKRQIAATRNFTILIVVLLGSIAYMLLNRFRLKMQMRQREALEGKRLAEAEAQRAMEQLDIFRQHLLDKNAIIEQWQSANEIKETSEDHNKRLSELSNHLILSEEDWARFKVLFDSVYPGFFVSLRNKVPDISQGEQRMAALSKLKLTAREAANLLGISPNTVYTTRRRLRQRLGLEQDADLDPYFTSFVS